MSTEAITAEIVADIAGRTEDAARAVVTVEGLHKQYVTDAGVQPAA
jgi:hypothetical protein